MITDCDFCEDAEVRHLAALFALHTPKGVSNLQRLTNNALPKSTLKDLQDKSQKEVRKSGPMGCDLFHYRRQILFSLKRWGHPSILFLNSIAITDPNEQDPVALIEPGQFAAPDVRFVYQLPPMTWWQRMKAWQTQVFRVPTHGKYSFFDLERLPALKYRNERKFAQDYHAGLSLDRFQKKRLWGADLEREARISETDSQNIKRQKVSDFFISILIVRRKQLEQELAALLPDLAKQ